MKGGRVEKEERSEKQDISHYLLCIIASREWKGGGLTARRVSIYVRRKERFKVCVDILPRCLQATHGCDRPPSYHPLLLLAGSRCKVIVHFRTRMPPNSIPQKQAFARESGRLWGASMVSSFPMPDKTKRQIRGWQMLLGGFCQCRRRWSSVRLRDTASTTPRAVMQQLGKKSQNYINQRVPTYTQTAGLTH